MVCFVVLGGFSSRLLPQVEESEVGSGEEMLRAPERAGNFQPRLPHGSGNLLDAWLADFDN